MVGKELGKKICREREREREKGELGEINSYN
jgi:hypothetical protein